jgi:hypothetical protein
MLMTSNYQAKKKHNTAMSIHDPHFPHDFPHVSPWFSRLFTIFPHRTLAVFGIPPDPSRAAKPRPLSRTLEQQFPQLSDWP